MYGCGFKVSQYLMRANHPKFNVVKDSFRSDIELSRPYSPLDFSLRLRSNEAVTLADRRVLNGNRHETLTADSKKHSWAPFSPQDSRFEMFRYRVVMNPNGGLSRGFFSMLLNI